MTPDKKNYEYGFTIRKWAEYFKDKEGINITVETIRNRVASAVARGLIIHDIDRKEAWTHDKVEVVMVYSESAIRRALEDLLPQQTNDAKKSQQIEILASLGVPDRIALFTKGPWWFKNSEFPPYGKGRAFASAILGKNIRRNIDAETLREIADQLGFPEINKDNIINAFATQGINNRKTLLGIGVRRFTKMNFVPFGKGVSVARIILGRSIKNLTIEILHEIADQLGFSRISNQKENRTPILALAAHGIDNRKLLLDKGVAWFEKAKFIGYGGRKSFVKAVLGRSVNHITVDILNEIADVLGFPDIDYEYEKKQQIKALNVHGITNRDLLIKKGPCWFKKTEFPPYGKGKAFATAILGKSPGRNIYVTTLIEIADVLGL